MKYRSKGSIGLMVPPRCNETNLEEAYRLRPPGLTWCIASLGMSEFSPFDFDTALANTEAATQELVQRKVSVIVQAGLPVQLSRGPSYFRELELHLQRLVGDDIPLTTDASAVLQALREVGGRRISVVTPYQARSVQGLVGMFEAEGFDVASASGEELSLNEIITELDSDAVYTKAMRAFCEHPDVDAIYISCPQWPVLENVARIEEETGKPVVTQFTAIMWWSLRTLGLDDRIAGYGRLLEDMN